MTNTELNKYHRGRMKGTCSEAVQFDWQDGEFMDFLLGGLPVIHKESLRDKAQDKYYRLEKAYRTYSFFSTDDEYIAKMEQMGFLSHFSRKGMTYCSFVIDTLADYLIARYMWEDLSGLDTKACIAVIEKKLDAFYGLHEMLILLLFDKFSPDYEKIRDILRETKLIERLDQDTLVKVHFRPEDISAFQKFFVPRSHKESLLYFAGYVNKPFNCTNYLNQYYLKNDEKQIKELTKLLSRKHTLGMLRSRLKNALYYMVIAMAS